MSVAGAALSARAVLKSAQQEPSSSSSERTSRPSTWGMPYGSRRTASSCAMEWNAATAVAIVRTEPSIWSPTRPPMGKCRSLLSTQSVASGAGHARTSALPAPSQPSMWKGTKYTR